MKGKADVLLSRQDAGFGHTGLKVDSLIKLDKIATVLKGLVVGELGELDQQAREEVNRKLTELFRM
jgi:mRNA interferase MazF